MKDSPKNPSGFSERLRLLREGWGYSTRDLANESGVSHGTIANWLSGTSRANLDEVAKVAAVFGWTAAELYDGTPRHDVMNRVARLEGFRARAQRMAEEIIELNPAPSATEMANLAVDAHSVPAPHRAELKRAILRGESASDAETRPAKRGTKGA